MRRQTITIYGCGQEEAEWFREAAGRFGAGLAITDVPVSEENARFAKGRCVSVGHKTMVTEPVLRALKRAGVRYLSTRSVGCNHIDMDAAVRLGIEVGNVAYSPDSVADYTLMLMLMLLRNMKSVLKRSAEQDYRPEAAGREIRDLTVGIIGAGRIGRAVMERLKGFGCRILLSDSGRSGSGEIEEYVKPDVLLKESDIVTLHIPLSADTCHYLDGSRISRMKRGAAVVNTGRGALIDTGALVRELKSGRIAGAALDVLEGEDGIFYRDLRGQEVNHKYLKELQAMPNVLITPHTAYYTEHALRDMIENTIANCMEFERREVFIKKAVRNGL